MKGSTGARDGFARRGRRRKGEGVGLIWGGVTRSEKGVRVGPGGQQGADTVEAERGRGVRACGHSRR
jgi:hypothetical protein